MDRLGLNPGFLAAQLFTICACGWPLLNLLILVWVYRDARSRGENGALWIIITLIGGVIGLILWLIVRPPHIQYTYQQEQYAPLMM